MMPLIFPVTSHTDRVGQGTTFVAVKGFSHDGASFIPVALEKGATTIVLEKESYSQEIRDLCQAKNARVCIVDHARKALAELSSQALDYPSHNLTIIGITGTKGKTSTAYLTFHMLKTFGYKTALLSTVYNIMHDQVVDESSRTTPESDYIQMFFALCIKQGVTHVVMEVSSHALALARVWGIDFSAIGFTNLGLDHLDFHKILDEYFATKMLLFDCVKPSGTIIINADNEWGVKAFAHALKKQLPVVTYGACQPVDSPSHMPLHIIANTCDGLQIRLGNRDIRSSLLGSFNAYNISMASLLAHSVDVPYSVIQKSLDTFAGIPGRLQRHILKNGAHAFVDFAHNPIAMQEALTALRPHTGHLIVVFGCGGNKDASKRPVMGGIAAQFADVIIVTDDNPRFEDRMSIIDQILGGIPDNKKSLVTVQPDRDKAIALAASVSRNKSIIALLGKGHENHYLIQGQSFHFDDLEQIKQF
jgi:UDP-N-acetylmuramoyl-L-alanyl-D-glutamate--2,6-diaminopimelate ligase